MPVIKLLQSDMRSFGTIIHDKAIRLIEGGVVSVDGHCVKLHRQEFDWEICNICKMDCLCKLGSDMSMLCMECDEITRDYCYLELVTND